MAAAAARSPPETTRHGPCPALGASRITKRFPGVLANDRVSLRLYAGEIHGLVGENGCGKSTLIKMLSGAYQPTGGRILKKRRSGRADQPDRRPGGRDRHGVPGILPRADADRRREHLSRPAGRDAAARSTGTRCAPARAQVLAAMDVAIDVDAPVGDLSVAEQQLVEIAKALQSDASMIILDEPTTALGLAEIERLHGLLQRLKERGVSILYISHRLDEVVELVDCVTILKDGKSSPAPIARRSRFPSSSTRWSAMSGSTIRKKRRNPAKFCCRSKTSSRETASPA